MEAKPCRCHGLCPGPDFCAKPTPIYTHEGWKLKWIAPPSKTLVKVGVPGPFKRHHPKLIKAQPYTSTCNRCCGEDECGPKSRLRNGIPDPWLEYLAWRDGKNEKSKNDVRLCREYLQLTKYIWCQMGIPMTQGIPDPYKIGAEFSTEGPENKDKKKKPRKKDRRKMEQQLEKEKKRDRPGKRDRKKIEVLQEEEEEEKTRNELIKKEKKKKKKKRESKDLPIDFMEISSERRIQFKEAPLFENFDTEVEKKKRENKSRPKKRDQNEFEIIARMMEDFNYELVAKGLGKCPEDLEDQTPKKRTTKEKRKRISDHQAELEPRESKSNNEVHKVISLDYEDFRTLRKMDPTAPIRKDSDPRKSRSRSRKSHQLPSTPSSDSSSEELEQRRSSSRRRPLMAGYTGRKPTRRLFGFRDRSNIKEPSSRHRRSSRRSQTSANRCEHGGHCGCKLMAVVESTTKVEKRRERPRAASISRTRTSIQSKPSDISFVGEPNPILAKIIFEGQCTLTPLSNTDVKIKPAPPRIEEEPSMECLRRPSKVKIVEEPKLIMIKPPADEESKPGWCPELPKKLPSLGEIEKDPSRESFQIPPIVKEPKSILVKPAVSSEFVPCVCPDPPVVKKQPVPSKPIPEERPPTIPKIPPVEIPTRNKICEHKSLCGCDKSPKIKSQPEPEKERPRKDPRVVPKSTPSKTLGREIVSSTSPVKKQTIPKRVSIKDASEVKQQPKPTGVPTTKKVDQTKLRPCRGDCGRLCAGPEDPDCTFEGPCGCEPLPQSRAVAKAPSSPEPPRNSDNKVKKKTVSDVKVNPLADTDLVKMFCDETEELSKKPKPSKAQPPEPPNLFRCSLNEPFRNFNAGKLASLKTDSTDAASALYTSYDPSPMRIRGTCVEPSRVPSAGEIPKTLSSVRPPLTMKLHRRTAGADVLKNFCGSSDEESPTMVYTLSKVVAFKSTHTDDNAPSSSAPSEVFEKCKERKERGGGGGDEQGKLTEETLALISFSDETQESGRDV